MNKLNYVLFCEYGIVSLDNRIPSFIGVFSKLTTQALPFTKERISVAVNFSLDSLEKDIAHDLDISVKSPSGKGVKSFKQKTEPSSTDSSIGVLFTVNNAEFNEEGIYNFEILLDNKKIGVASLNIVLNK